eukprot:TRINITY_DN5944_c2_g1_i1.p1 TRINITY_DN5944_c2_g1~~TRINITY_DN5944_c2_g1_i1.p1  ORF type:complete len:233 (-),score=48.59 TRINITY_DN5944_c2_g1_i1:403-1101(-)
MRGDQLLRGLGLVLVSMVATYLYAVRLGIYSGDVAADMHHFGHEVVVPCQVVSALRSQMKHLSLECQQNKRDPDICKKDVLQVEVTYEAPDNTWKHFTTHFDIAPEDLYLCETVHSCLQHFGLKYGENDCFYGTGVPSHVVEDALEDVIDHDSHTEEEIYLLPDHPHNPLPLIYFTLLMVVTLVPCCFFVGVIMALASCFDMEVNLRRAQEYDIEKFMPKIPVTSAQSDKLK